MRLTHLGRSRIRPTLVVMGFNKPSWTARTPRTEVSPAHFRQLAEIRERRQRQARERIASRQLEGSLLSLAALLGSPVKDPAGHTIGELRDVVVRWTAGSTYPTMTAIVLRGTRWDALIGARWIELSPPASVRLRSTKTLAQTVERRPADVALAHDVLDRQVVDSTGTQIVRPADVYLANMDGELQAIGIEVGVRALLRRLGPRFLRSRIRPQQVIDWRDIVSFAPARDDGKRLRGRRSDIAGRPGAGVALGEPAADVKRLGPSEVREALRAYKARDGGAAS